MAIEVEIHIVAIDTDRAVKSTRAECVTVPKKVMSLHEVLGGSEDDILRRIGDSVFSAAVHELQTSKSADVGRAMIESGGGRIGGRAGAAAVMPPASVAEAAPGPPAPPAAPAPGASDPLANMLGLDLIRHQAGKDRQARNAPGPAPAPPRQAGPPVAGFPR